MLTVVMKVQNLLNNAVMRLTSTIDCRGVQGAQHCQLFQNKILFPERRPLSKSGLVQYQQHWYPYRFAEGEPAHRQL